MSTSRVPHHTYEAKERAVLNPHAVSRLPRIYRSVVELCDFDRLPLSEAARKLGLTFSAVKSRRPRAARGIVLLVGTGAFINARGLYAPVE
jgi:DNA-directed RNA polymerase specialized sigma24 family protein